MAIIAFGKQFKVIIKWGYNEYFIIVSIDIIKGNNNIDYTKQNFIKKDFKIIIYMLNYSFL